MTISVVLRDARAIAGVVHAAGSTLALDDALAYSLVGSGLATYADGARSYTQWVNVPSVFRVRLTGTGNCIMDARDKLGVETLGVAAFSAQNATNQIETPYAGETAWEVRFRCTGTCQPEVM